MKRKIGDVYFDEKYKFDTKNFMPFYFISGFIASGERSEFAIREFHDK